MMRASSGVDGQSKEAAQCRCQPAVSEETPLAWTVMAASLAGHPARDRPGG
jgi:hypothetical protein